MYELQKNILNLNEFVDRFRDDLTFLKTVFRQTGRLEIHLPPSKTEL